jgi:hypothetical protein
MPNYPLSASLIAALCFAVPAAALAQGTATAAHAATHAPVPTVALPPSGASIDPQRLALGREVALAFWPDGTAQKIMGPMMEARNTMVSQMLKTSPKDVGAKGAKDGDQTLGDFVREKDPNFERRMEITNHIMGEEVGKLMAAYEPQLRESLARLYARRFTTTELSDLAAFLRTPSGKSYSSQMMMIMSDPEMQQAIAGLAPRLMQAMPAIIARIKKATADLPPPAKQKAKSAELPST